MYTFLISFSTGVVVSKKQQKKFKHTNEPEKQKHEKEPKLIYFYLFTVLAF